MDWQAIAYEQQLFFLDLPCYGKTSWKWSLTQPTFSKKSTTETPSVKHVQR